MTLSVQFQRILTPKRVPIRLPDHRQLAESEYIETIVDALELADTAEDFAIIRAAIGHVKSSVNRMSLHEMLRLRFEDLEKGKPV